MRCEVCGYKFLFASSTKCPSCGDLREDIVKERDIQAAMGHANLDANALTNHSVIGKRPFGEVANVIASQPSIPMTEEERLFPINPDMEKIGRTVLLTYGKTLNDAYRAMAAVAAQDPPQISIMDSTVGLKAANAHLTRQLAAQALAHAEQMENVGAKAAKMLLAKNFRIAKLESQLAMRVTPTTQPTDAQQTAGDMKATQEPKAFPAGALKAGGSDPRRMGP